MDNSTSKPWSIMVNLIIIVLSLAGTALSCSPSSPSDLTPSPADTEPSLPSPTPQLHKAPDFTLPTMTGAEITLSELEGTPVVLVFWATSCPYCAIHLAYLEAAAQQGEGKIEIVAVNIGEDISRVQTFFGGYEPTMIVALDETEEVFWDYNSRYNNPRGFMPITFFINSEGVIQHIKFGAFMSEAELWNSLRSLF